MLTGGNITEKPIFVRRREERGNQQQARDTANRNREQSDQHATAIHAVREEINRQANAHRRASNVAKPYELKMLRATCIGAGGAVVAAIAAIVSVVLFYKLTTGQMEEQRIEQRPWATIDVEIGSDLVFANTADPTATTAEAKIKITLGNAGKVPAENLIVEAGCANTVIYADLFRRVMVKAQDARNIELSRRYVGEAVFPSQTVVKDEKACVNAGEWSSFQGSKAYRGEPEWTSGLSPTYYGVVSYRYAGEPPRTQHATGFAFAVVRKDGQPILSTDNIPMSELKIERINDPDNGVFIAY